MISNTLLVSDLDGTLLTSEQKISKKNEQAIRTFKEAGGIFTFATGRTEASVLPYVNQLDIDVPVVVYNGARIHCHRTGEVLYHTHLTLEEEMYENIIRLHNDDIAVLIYQDTKVYTPSRNSIVKAHEQKEGIISHTLTKHIFDPHITKILFISKTAEQLTKVKEYLLRQKQEWQLVYSEHNYLELLPSDATKGNAIHWLKRFLQIEDYYTVTIGDNCNDISMIKEADLGIAVENAHPQLKKVANLVTIHHRQDAIAKVLESHLPYHLY